MGELPSERDPSVPPFQEVVKEYEAQMGRYFKRKRLKKTAIVVGTAFVTVLGATAAAGALISHRNDHATTGTSATAPSWCGFDRLGPTYMSPSPATVDVSARTLEGDLGDYFQKYVKVDNPGGELVVSGNPQMVSAAVQGGERPLCAYGGLLYSSAKHRGNPVPVFVPLSQIAPLNLGLTRKDISSFTGFVTQTNNGIAVVVTSSAKNQKRKAS